nr:MAG TPA: hypothetical protein [Caudoviricetes sp.]
MIPVLEESVLFLLRNPLLSTSISLFHGVVLLFYVLKSPFCC